MSLISSALSAPLRATLSSLAPEQREKEDSARVTRQRPVLRVSSELALVGIIRDGPHRSGGEWIMKVLKELVCYFVCICFSDIQNLLRLQLSNDSSLSSLPLLTTFLKSYSRPYLGLISPLSKQIPTSSEPGTLSSAIMDEEDGAFPSLTKEEEELVEQDIRDRFKRMCEGYFDSVAKKLVIEHKVGSQNILSANMISLCYSVYKNKIAGIMKHTSGRARYLRIDNKPMRK